MRRSFILFAVVLISNVLFCNCEQQNQLDLEAPYLGQDPPGLSPKLFAPDIVSTGLNEIGSSFTKDGKEFLFSIGPNPYMSIIQIKYESGGWSIPEVATFSGYYDDFDAKFSPDGNRVYFSSSRPNPGKEWNKDDYDIWMAERNQDGWSEPENLGNSINSEKPEYCPTLSENGNLYFCSEKEGGYGEGDIYVSKFENDEYADPVNLGPAINGEFFEADPYIAPDESYLIITCWGRPDTLGKGDLYISFKNTEGIWTELKNMGAVINSVELEHSAWVSNDGKYLFFSSNRKNNLTSPMYYKQYSDLLYKPLNGMNDIYWIDAKIIDELR